MGAELLGLLVAIIVIAGLVVALVRRRSVRSTAAAGSQAETPASVPVDIDSDAAVMLVPLPTRRNEALALGTDASLDAFERSGLAHRSGVRSSGPLPGVIRRFVAGAGGLATRAADNDIDSGRIVALSDETMKQLRAGKAARDKGGEMLGLVRGKHGKIAHVMRFDKAGAKALTASNAATLAITAALCQQLEHIEEQLTEIRETLDGLVADVDRERLAKAVAANVELKAIADDIRRRGEMTEADRVDLASLNLPVTTGVIEADFKFEEMLDRVDPQLNRTQRQTELERLRGKERLEYWLALRVEVELAQTRRDLLDLYWEQLRHPETAEQLATAVQASITARQERMCQVGELLEKLADPEARTRLDPLRQLSRLRLRRQQRAVAILLEQHGEAFRGPAADPFALVGKAEPDDVVLLTPGHGPATDRPPPNRNDPAGAGPFLREE